MNNTPRTIITIPKNGKIDWTAVLDICVRMCYNMDSMNDNECHSKEIGDTALAPKHYALGLPGSYCAVSPFHLEMIYYV